MEVHQLFTHFRVHQSTHVELNAILSIFIETKTNFISRHLVAVVAVASTTATAYEQQSLQQSVINFVVRAFHRTAEPGSERLKWMRMSESADGGRETEREKHRKVSDCLCAWRGTTAPTNDNVYQLGKWKIKWWINKMKWKTYVNNTFFVGNDLALCRCDDTCAWRVQAINRRTEKRKNKRKMANSLLSTHETDAKPTQNRIRRLPYAAPMHTNRHFLGSEAANLPLPLPAPCGAVPMHTHKVHFVEWHCLRFCVVCCCCGRWICGATNYI